MDFDSRWNYALDLNGDGTFTVSDIAAWFWYILYAPGDGLIYAFSLFPDTNAFFELSPESYYSGWSLAVSIALWLIGLSILGDLN